MAIKFLIVLFLEFPFLSLGQDYWVHSYLRTVNSLNEIESQEYDSCKKIKFPEIDGKTIIVKYNDGVYYYKILNKKFQHNRIRGHYHQVINYLVVFHENIFSVKLRENDYTKTLWITPIKLNAKHRKEIHNQRGFIVSNDSHIVKLMCKK